MILVFSTSRSVVSHLIRWVTGEPVSHVAICTTAGGVPVVLHADMGGVQLTTMHRFLAHNVVIAAYEKTRCAEDDCSLANAVDAIGRAYDYLSLFMRACSRAIRWLGLAVRNPLSSPRSMVCSEFVARSVSDFAAYDPEEVTPGELLSYCENSESWQTLPVLNVSV